jgi:hypothetical protein
MNWLLAKLVPSATILILISCAICVMAQAAEVNPP